MSRNRQVLALVLILSIAAALRLTGLDWDDYEHYHPDERYITWVATTIEMPSRLGEAFDPRRSPFNPFYWAPNAVSEGIVVPQDTPRSFAYGHLPLYLGVLATRVVELVPPALVDNFPQHWLLVRDLLNGGGFNEFHHLTAVSRALTALFDTATVLLVFLLGRRLFGAPVGLLAAAFLSINVMHIQLARFFTVDPYLTFFTVAAVYSSVRLVSAGSRRAAVTNLGLASVAIGLAVGSKFSAMVLLLPLAASIWLWSGERKIGRRRLSAGGIALALVVFALTNPFVLLDWTCNVITPQIDVGPWTIPAFDLKSCYLDNVLRQTAMVRGDAGFAFTRQYVGTLPYIYPLLMQLRWGMGPALGVAALVGFAWAAYRGGRWLQAFWRKRSGLTALARSTATGSEVVVLAWTMIYFLIAGAFFTKFMRYMQPLTPLLMVYAAALLWRALKGRWRYVASGLVIATTALYALAFINMYEEEHPWNETSRWIYNNVQPGARFTSELWDDPLPSSMEIDDRFYNRHIYEYGEVDWLSGTGERDDADKLKLNLSRIAQTDYLTVSSNRGYGVVMRLEHLYPLSHQYYQRLFAGDLGFEVVLVTGRSPRLGDFNIWPDRFGGLGLVLPAAVLDFLAEHAGFSPGRADESFTVYDQPLAILLYNREHYTVEQMLTLFQLP